MNLSEAQAYALIVQVGLPLAVGLVTKKSTNKNVKTILLAVLTAANTYVLGLQTGGSARELVIAGLVGLVVSLGTHYGFLKPTGISEAAQAMMVKDADPEVHFSPEPDPWAQVELSPGETQPEISDADLEEIAQAEKE